MSLRRVVGTTLIHDVLRYLGIRMSKKGRQVSSRITIYKRVPALEALLERTNIYRTVLFFKCIT